MSAAPTSQAGRRLWHFFDVVMVLLSRDLKSRYRNTAFGIGWAVATPLAYLFTFYFVFKIVLSIGIERYGSFAFAGIIAWQFFQTSLLQSAASISGHANLIRQPGFPRASLPIVATLSAFVTLLTSVPIILLINIIEGDLPGLELVFLPLVLLTQFILTLALGYFLSALNVALRDTQYILVIVLQLLFFLTPIFYTVDMIPNHYVWLYSLNPMVHIVESFRSIFWRGEAPDARILLFIFAVSVGLLVGGLAYFLKSASAFLEEL